MAKQLLSLRHVYKIPSEYLAENDWDINISLREAKEKEFIVSLASSSTIRFIDEIVKSGFDEEKVKLLKSKIKNLKKMKVTSRTRSNISKYYKELDEMLLVEDYVLVVMNTKSDYDRANKTFVINGKRYRRLLSTSGGVKNSTILYTNEDIYDELIERINCGRDMSKEFVPGKLSAYMGLSCSASNPVSNPGKVLVVHDCETKFTSNVIEIDDSESEYPAVLYKDNYPITLNVSDGFGLVTYDMAQQWAKDLHLDYIPAGFTIRNAFCKGMSFVFDFKMFAEEVAENYIVKDVWGCERDIREIDMILTTSMLKLWDSYDSWEHYEECYKKYGYSFSVTKTTPKELDEERNLNYQFIQSLKLDDDMIDELIAPTVSEIKEILGRDYRKSIIYMRGMNMKESNVQLGGHIHTQAVMVDERMIDDPYVKSQIKKMIRKRINDAKIGVLKVKGNFQILSGDPYALCQSIFGLEVTGLLKAGELYSRHWIDKDVSEVVGMRAPMTCENNIIKMNVVTNNEMNKWYKYMNTVTILNSWDTTCASLNGCDYDGDSLFSTNNKIIINAVEKTPAIVCIQKAAKKKLCTEDDFIRADKASFGDEIGAITNRITAMFDVLSKFEPGSKEYKELEYRIMTGQNYQQNSIDRAKGIISNPMPKEWYKVNPNLIKEDDDYETIKLKEFNMSVLADKKPYFFIYNYPELKTKLKDIKDSYEEFFCLTSGLSNSELSTVDDLTDDQKYWLNRYSREIPVFDNKCVMNKICWRIEEEFDEYLNKRFKVNDFDYTIMKSECEVSEKRRKAVIEVFNKYRESVKIRHMNDVCKVKRKDDDFKLIGATYIENFIRDCYEICPNQEELCNILLDVCYQNNYKKQFVWMVCGDQIIKNLLSNNNNKFKYLERDINGDVEFNGIKFKLKEKAVL